jgi:hypothetical protein
MLCESIKFGLLFQCPRRELPANIQNLYQEKPTITISYKMTVNNTHYWKGVFVVLKASTTPSKGLVFGEIDCIICEEKTSPLIVMTLYTTVEFCNDSFCYVIERLKPSLKYCCTLADLLDFHPLDGTLVSDKLFVRRKYFVW